MPSEIDRMTEADSRISDRRRLRAHHARQRWAAEVTQALTEQRMSIHAAAKAIGISPGRLQAWLSQDVEPSPRVMADLARVVGRGHYHLLQLLDWLPTELADVPLRFEATEKLREAIADAQRWLHSAARITEVQNASLVAAALLDKGSDWYVALRNSVRGERYPVRYETQVAIWPAGSSDGRTGEDRRRIERLIGEALRRTSATWRTPEPMPVSRWAPRPDLVLTVPVLCANRSRGRRPNLQVPPSILVVGISDAGTREVAALLADLLDWAYLDVAGLAAEQYGLTPDTPREIVQNACANLGRRVLHSPLRIGRSTVWSFSQPGPILQTIRDLGSDVPLVIHLCGHDRLLAHLARQPDAGPEAADLVETAQNVTRRTLRSTRDESTYLILDLPPSTPLTGHHAEDVDAVFDDYVDLAFQAADWLHSQHNGPSLGQAPGLLGELRRRQP
jgi:transcriptional regulator with XRE-family HTH domain